MKLIFEDADYEDEFLEIELSDEETKSIYEGLPINCLFKSPRRYRKNLNITIRTTQGNYAT